MLKSLRGDHIFVAEREGVWMAHAHLDPRPFQKERRLRIHITRDRMPPRSLPKRWVEANIETVLTLGNRIAPILGSWTPSVSWAMHPGHTENYDELWIDFIRRPGPCGVQSE